MIKHIKRSLSAFLSFSYLGGGKSLVYAFIVICFISTTTYAQTFNFKNAPLNEVLKKIESQTKLVFNYDADLLKQHTYTGTLTLTEKDKAIRQLFYDTPFEFELLEDNVIVMAPIPKKYRICGYVKGIEYNEALAYTNLIFKEQGKGTQADENGYFEMEVTAYKNERFTLTYIGCKSRTFMIQEWPKNCKTIRLQENLEMLGLNIVVKDYIIRGVSEGEEYGSVHFNYDRLGRTSINNEYDALKTIQQLPGITSIDESATNLHIRGSAPDHNLLLWENAPIYEPGHLFGMISPLNPYILDEINVFKTAFPPQYGNAVGGIVDMKLSNEVSNDFSGGIGVNFTDAHAYFQIPAWKDRLSLILAGRRSISELWSSPTLYSYVDRAFENVKLNEESGEYEEDKSLDDENELQFYDINAKAIYQLNDKVTLKSSILNTGNEAAYFAELESDSLESQDVVNFSSAIVSTEATIDWTENYQSRLYHVWSDYDNSYNSSFSEEIEEEEEGNFNESFNTYNTIKDQHIGWMNHWSVSEQLNLDIGYIYEKKAVKLEFEESSLWEKDIRDSLDGAGQFHNLTASANYEKNALSIQAGIRGTYYNELNRAFFAPRFNLQYRLNQDWKLKCSGGHFYQFISRLSQIGTETFNTANNLWVLNNNVDQKPLNTNKISAGFIFNKKGWLIDAEAYYHKTKGISSLSTFIANDAELDTRGTSTAMGIEFLLNKNWKQYKFWMNYTLSQQNYDFPKFSDELFPSPNDHRHNLSLVNNLVFGKWQASLIWNFRSGLPFSEPTDELSENSDPDDPDDIYYEILFDDINEERLPHYNRVDLGLSYTSNLYKDRLKLEGSFSVLNILNRENIAFRNYYPADIEDTGEPKTIETERRLLGITPQFMLRLYW